jgi:hypothetical protein
VHRTDFGFCMSGVEPPICCTRELISEANLKEMFCEDRMWIELA